MNAGQIELAKSYITWMRRGNTLSLDGYYPGWENAARDDIGDDDTCAPSIGRVEGPTARLHVVCHALKNRELPPAPSRDTRRLPDLKRENPSFAALLIKYVNERLGGDAPRVYNAAHVNRKTYSAIVGNELRPVSKTTAVQFALALHLTRAEADEFIKSAGYAFSASILEDIIVCACIEATITVDVPNGTHSISAKSGWVESNHLNLDFGTGDKKVRLIANYAPKEELKKEFKKISWWNPFHNIKETISTIKKSAQGRNEDGEPILALKDETPQEC